MALLLVLLGLTGTARLQASLLAASAEAKARDEATALALEQLASFQSLATYTGYDNTLVSGNTERQGLLHTYRLDWSVSHTPEPDYKTGRICRPLAGGCTRVLAADSNPHPRTRSPPLRPPAVAALISASRFPDARR